MRPLIILIHKKGTIKVNKKVLCSTGFIGNTTKEKNHQNPMTHLAAIKSRFPEIVFTFDTKMAAFHSELNWVYKPEWDWLWSEKKINHLHMNDYGGGHMEWSKLNALPLGDGNIDFDPFFTTLKSKNYTGFYTLEASSKKADGSIDIEKMNRNLIYLNENI
jgi:sugar phosphate isomerase/epimerase